MFADHKICFDTSWSKVTDSKPKVKIVGLFSGPKLYDFLFSSTKKSTKMMRMCIFPFSIIKSTANIPKEALHLMVHDHV